MLKRFAPQDIDNTGSRFDSIGNTGVVAPWPSGRAAQRQWFGQGLDPVSSIPDARDRAASPERGIAAASDQPARNGSRALSLAIKHGLDRALAAVALLLAAPLFLLVMLAIRLEDGGPVFFRQTRVGERGRPFLMWKFRSMVVDAEARLAAIQAQSERDGTCFKMKNDPRVTRVGAVLRRLSLDELPQLFNILFGHMSLVGPRPALPGEVLTYSPAAHERLAGKPGLTCTWQVSGRANIPFEQQVELDVAYLRTRSLAMDALLLLRTIPAVLMARGAY